MAQVRLPRQRSSETVSVLVGGYAGRVTVVRPDDRPPQVHLMAGGHGSTVAGLADAVGTAISLGLANGAGFDDYRVALELLGLSADQLGRE
ncbi:hypothetical protein KGQ20_24120 [Catenulispora sp. NF23]|uniref:Uncharacterized protein n=1 Tax=Catenulispora pinistramenti TaxID=2705254 RepID=A0ABS5KXS8_9ACTN|nr:hypothetical protein [Catenulispora pinistramenti]MBS2535854.1 hypothetical protein [Catenulispora pinistramenti]MBS2550866.1 hypothetical protein [Catenulispora pinistramenti]